MNILVVTRSTTEHAQTGGMETHLKNLLLGLSKGGHKIDVITTSFPAEEKVLINDKVINEGNITYYYLGETTPGLNPPKFIEGIYVGLGLLKRTRIEGSKNFYKESSKKFDKLTAKTKYDIIVSQSTAGYGIARKSTIPIISIIHGTITNELKNRIKANKSIKNWTRFLTIDLPDSILEFSFRNKRFFESISKIVSVSDKLKEDFIKEQKLNPDKVVVIYNGVNDKVFFPLPFGTKKDFRCLYVGRMDREKGVDIIIKALRYLKTEQNLIVECDLIGSGVHLAELKKLAIELEVQDLVHFWGSVSNNEVAEFYRKSSVFLFPTKREEGHPVTVSESFNSGLPVIATKKGGIKDVLRDGETGFLIPPNDPIFLAKKIKYLYDNPKELQEMSSAVLAEARKKYTIKAMIVEYTKLINELKN